MPASSSSNPSNPTLALSHSPFYNTTFKSRAYLPTHHTSLSKVSHSSIILLFPKPLTPTGKQPSQAHMTSEEDLLARPTSTIPSRKKQPSTQSPSLFSLRLSSPQMTSPASPQRTLPCVSYTKPSPTLLTTTSNGSRSQTQSGPNNPKSTPANIPLSLLVYLSWKCC